ncbi:MAG: SDR family NAD(P)-dependent oxidoreductase [Solirubrobacteraceae bacterium]
MIGLADKVALVTGASGGLGREVVTALCAAGARVAATGRDEAALADILAASGGSPVPIPADLRVAADAERAVAATVARHGGLDLLVNAAGVLRHGALDVFAEDDWDLVFDTNVKSCFLTTKYAVPAMRARGGGAIVNVASVYAHAATAGVAAYAASKAAVVALTKAAALDHARDGIRVNGVAPGSMDTPMVLDVARRRSPGDPRAVIDAAGRLNPIGRLVEPREAARLVLFLLSDEASAIVGCTYTIDGGRLAAIGGAAAP